MTGSNCLSCDILLKGLAGALKEFKKSGFSTNFVMPYLLKALQIDCSEAMSVHMTKGA